MFSSAPLNFERILSTDCTFSGDVTGGDEVGGAVGSQGITLSNCTTSGTVTGVTEVGGMVGQGDTLMDCSSSADVSGEGSVGGLAGKVGLIERSFATASAVVASVFVYLRATLFPCSWFLGYRHACLRSGRRGPDRRRPRLVNPCWTQRSAALT